MSGRTLDGVGRRSAPATNAASPCHRRKCAHTHAGLEISRVNDNTRVRRREIISSACDPRRRRMLLSWESVSGTNLRPTTMSVSVAKTGQVPKQSSTHGCQQSGEARPRVYDGVDLTTESSRDRGADAQRRHMKHRAARETLFNFRDRLSAATRCNTARRCSTVPARTSSSTAFCCHGGDLSDETSCGGTFPASRRSRRPITALNRRDQTGGSADHER